MTFHARLKFVFILNLILLFGSCIKDPETGTQYGKKAQFIPFEELDKIEQKAPQEFVNTGKIAYYSPYLFMVDHMIGIHIIDLSDTVDVKRISFIAIPGVSDISLKNNILYANNGPHLVLFDVSDIHHVFVIDKIKSVFEVNATYPPPNTWFECIDKSNVWITGWTDAVLVNPKCKT